MSSAGLCSLVLAVAAAAGGGNSPCMDAIAMASGSCTTIDAAVLANSCTDARCRSLSPRLVAVCDRVAQKAQHYTARHSAQGRPGVISPTTANALSAYSKARTGRARRLACDADYCTNTCGAFAYCQDPAQLDSNCANAPSDCGPRCSSCGSGASSSGAGGSASGAGNGCDQNYCGTVCGAFAHCANAATQDASCAGMPPDCGTRCSNCLTDQTVGAAGITAEQLFMHNMVQNAEAQNRALFNAKPECHPMTAWNASRVQEELSIMLRSAGMGSDAVTGILLSLSGVNGKTLAYLTRSDMKDLNVSAGHRMTLLQQINSKKLGIMPNVPPSSDPCSDLYGSTPRVWADFNLMRLTGVDESSYEYTMVFWWNEYWLEDRHIFLPDMVTQQDIDSCQLNVKDAYGAPSSKCANWGSGGLWGSGATGDAGKARGQLILNAAGAPESIHSFPVDYNGPAFWAPNIASHHALYRASFNVEMIFDDFPFDKQRLNVHAIYIPPDADPAQFQALSGGVDPHWKSTSGNDAPGWTIRNVALTNSSFVLSPPPHGSDHPQMTNSILGNQTFSALKLEITVERQSEFYMINLVLPIALLNMLSWSSFLLQPSAVDVRLATTMTIFLALVAFQFIVNDALPKTGKMTKMHKFIVLTNVMIVVSGLESLLVYWLVEQDIADCRTARSQLMRSIRAILPCMKGPKDKVDAPVRRADVSETLRDIENTAAAKQNDHRAAAHDGVVTREELDAIHNIDRVCAVVFPIVFGMASAVLLR